MSIRVASFCFLSAFVIASTTSRAQLVEYEFTGSRVAGDADFGDTIAGVVRLDFGAEPNGMQDVPFGRNAYWTSVNGAFAIDAVTSGGLVAGTALGGTTYLNVFDYPLYVPPYSSGIIHIDSVVDGDQIGVSLFSSQYGEAGDGVPEVSDWTPLDDDTTEIKIYFNDAATGFSGFSVYRLDSFDQVRDTIVIDGRDTGVEDFEYQGELLSDRIEAHTDAAKSHGQFVSQVNKLTRDLVKQGLLTDEERDAIMLVASESSIGLRLKR